MTQRAKTVFVVQINSEYDDTLAVYETKDSAKTAVHHAVKLENRAYWNDRILEKFDRDFKRDEGYWVVESHDSKIRIAEKPVFV